ncbi:S1 RNA-binding domain-containing protein [Candidatus Dojkabacteria bacterium]|nr:S1 RNA-binding domain-containing protein [Candidatus Dojkabacteria bacterium]
MAKKQNKVQRTDELLDSVVPPKTYKKGNIIEGTVIDVKDGQILVDVGGRAEGVISGREMKLEGKRVSKKAGDKILVYVVNPENEEGQIELSIRRTGNELKWHELEQAKLNETPIEVKVIEANTGGVIVEISESTRGFVPSSQLNNKRIYAPNMYSSKEDSAKVLQTKLAEMIGEVLKVKVMEIDKEKNKVILSEKSVYSETDLKLRNETLTSLKVGDVLEGAVTGIAPFGLFINAQGLEGLVHLSEISWDKVISPADFYHVGDIVKVQVIGLQDNGKRVAYSIKRLQEDPWKSIVQKYKVGQIVEGEVKSIADYGAFIKIEDGLNGLVHISELSSKLVKNPSQVVNVGDKIKVMIISISNEDRHLGLSLKRAQKDTSATTDDEPSRELEELDKIISESTEAK